VDAYTGEIRAFPYNYIPEDWLLCDGKTYQAWQFQALYSIIGNTWGGTAGQTFAVPNLGGRVVVSQGAQPGLTSWAWAETGGSETVALTYDQSPPHRHGLTIKLPLAQNIEANTTAAPNPDGSSWLAHPEIITGASASTGSPMYVKSAGSEMIDSELATMAVGAAGGGEAHENRQPFLTMLYCICTNGVYPVSD